MPKNNKATAFLMYRKPDERLFRMIKTLFGDLTADRHKTGLTAVSGLPSAVIERKACVRSQKWPLAKPDYENFNAV